MKLPELKRKASGIFYLDLRGQGLGRLSLETRDRATALDKRRQYALGQLSRPEPQPSRIPGNQTTMRELFDRAQATVWHPSQAKSQGTINSNVKILNTIIGDEPVAAMTYTRLEKLVEELRLLGYAPATIKRKLDAVSKVLRMATKWTDPQGRPLLAAKPTMPTIKVNNLKDRTVSPVEEAAIFNAIETRRQAEPGRQWRRLSVLIRFLLDTGARLGEALNVGPDDLSLVPTGDGGQATLVTFARYRTKSDKPRSVPLTSAVCAGLASLEGDLGFDGTKQRYFPLKEATAWYMWSNIRDDLLEIGIDIQDVTLHTLRHTCLSRLAQGGMDLLRLQMWAGHSDPKITAERYVHLRPGDLLSGISILQGSNGGNPASVIFGEAGGIRAEAGAVTIQ